MFKKVPAFLEGFKVRLWWTNLSFGIYQIDSILIGNIKLPNPSRVKLFKSKTVYLLPIVVGGGVLSRRFLCRIYR